MKFYKVDNYKNLLYFIYLPIFLNFLFNKYVQLNNFGVLSFIELNYYDLIITVLLASFLYYVGAQIKILLELPYKSTGIVVYLFSFFIVDNIVLFIIQDIPFKSLFLYTNIFWLAVFLFSKIKLKSILKIFFTYFFIYTSNILFNSKLTNQNNITGDVKDIHFQHVANIFEYSYFYSVNNPGLEGYTQLVAYIQALLHVIVKFSGEFVYMDSVLNVLFILTILLFLEIDFDYISKIILIALYSIIVFNSEWIKFLFIDSLMTEGVLAYLFCVFVVSISNIQNVIYKKNSILFFFFGFLFFSKQFISLLSLFIIMFFLITKKYRFQSIVGLSAVIIKELSYLSYFKNITKNYHLRDVDVKDFILDLLLLRDLKYSNLNEILRNLFFDKPIFLIFLYLIFLLIIYFSVYKLKEYDINFYTMIIFLNTCFVIILYLTLWKNMELESPIRYLLNLLLLKLVLQFKIIDKLKDVKR